MTEQTENLHAHSTLVVVPAYNAAQYIPELAERLRRFVCDENLLFVNDGSTDETLRLIQEANLNHINFPKNKGKGAALTAAFEYAIKVAIGLGCDIQKVMKFDRKHYYYPDLPKNYQISQFDMPIAYNGKITIPLEDGNAKDIGITRAHMEEDAGKLVHDIDPSFSCVDLNRTGTPLLEIVHCTGRHL